MDSRDEQLAQAVIEQLRIERAAADLTYKELELRTGITEQTIRRWMKGARPMPFSGLIQLSHAVGVPVEMLLSRAQSRLG